MSFDETRLHIEAKCFPETSGPLLRHAASVHTHAHTHAHVTDGSIQTDGGQTDGQTDGDCKVTLTDVRLSV